MVNFIALLTLVLLISPALANTVWYDSVTNREIVDISDSKSKDKIISEFGVSNSVESIKLKECENYRIKDNKFKAYDYCKENDDKKQAKKDIKDAKKELIKTKLSLTEEEFTDLVEALGL